MTQPTALSVVGKNTGEFTPSQLVAALAPQDKATIMALCMPKGATDSELAMYLYRCKEMGFDPLSKELVLQKRTSQDGTVNLSFITTRDALLRKAEINPNYAGINSGVVRENDTFLVDTEKGVVKHTFGMKRGKILAGWAVVYHKMRLPVVSIADFDEYSRANIKSPVWSSVPSAMIQKVAEVAALRRQFPVLAQGVYTAEEMDVEIVPDAPAETVDGTFDSVVSDKPSGPVVVQMTQTQDRKETPAPKPESTPSQPQPQEHASQPTNEPQSMPEKQETVETIIEIPEEALQPQSDLQDAYKLTGFASGKSGVGTPYAKIACEKDGQTVVLLAKGEEGLAEAGKLRENCMFKAEIYEEMGFNFVKSITVIN
jgi:phage recombination protein Bet